jgi:hypothetical protein
MSVEVGFWHKADITGLADDVRSRGKADLAVLRPRVRF